MCPRKGRTLDDIGETDDHKYVRLLGPTGLVGSGRAVGVTDGRIQLQRILSRQSSSTLGTEGDTELEIVVESGL